ncbi:MAG: DUF937 domain-containing protein [Burkholderiales bacterium]|nr:DUF937 domain-containing protein [Burkholderiales bacterium]
MANAILGQILGGVLGRGRQQSPFGAGRSPFGGGGAGTLVTMLLPLAMQWVQRSGGIGAVLDKFRQKGYTKQANSWLQPGPNQPLTDTAVHDVVGMDELSRLSQQLGMDRQEVASGMAEILPEVADHLTPDGEVPPDADDRLRGGISALENLLQQFRTHHA